MQVVGHETDADAENSEPKFFARARTDESPLNARACTCARFTGASQVVPLLGPTTKLNRFKDYYFSSVILSTG